MRTRLGLIPPLPHPALLLACVGSSALAQPAPTAAQRPTPPLFETIPWEAQAFPEGDVVVADFDGDGEPEIAYQRSVYALRGTPEFSDSSHGNIFIRRAHADLTFETVAEIPQASYSFGSQLLAADFDHDGRIDLAFTARLNSTNPDSVRWFHNTESGWVDIEIGRGSLPEQSFYLQRAVDLNTDGFPDLLATKDEEIWIAYGSPSGPGEFVATLIPNPDSTPAPFNEVYYHANADLDGDGRRDLILRLMNALDANTYETVGYFAVFGGETDATFTHPTVLSADPSHELLEVIDPENGDWPTRVYLQTDSEATTQSELVLPLTRGVTPSTIARAYSYTYVRLSNNRNPRVDRNGPRYLDLDGDGTTDRLGGSTRLVYNALTDSADSPSPRTIVGSATMDVDGDGLLDVVGPRGTQLGIADQQGRVAFPTAGSWFDDFSITSVIAVDLNGDGRDDVASNSAYLSPASIEGDWAPVPWLPDRVQAFTQVTARHPAFERPLLAWAIYGEEGNYGLLHWVSLDPPLEDLAVQTFDAKLRDPPTVVAVDLDGDDADELVFPARGTGDVPGQTLRVISPEGDAYAQRQVLSLDGQTFAIVAGDFNNDGWADVALGEYKQGLEGGADLMFFFNDGEGELLPAFTITPPAPVYALASTDLNGDGLDDIVGSSGDAVNTGRTFAWIQAASGVPTQGDIVLIGEGTIGAGFEIYAADLNHDNVMDLRLEGRFGGVSSNSVIVTSPLNPSQIAVWLFEDNPDTVPAGTVGDFNADGLPDLVSTPGQRGIMIDYGIGPRTPNPCAADLNGDGIADQGDIQTFIQLFLAQDPAVDFNSDGIVDLGDIQAFIAAFLAGC